MRYNTECCTVELSVRELCAMAHKSGDLDAAAPHRHTENMRKGGELHRSLQKAEKNYRAEVFLRHTTVHHGISYTVEGRADGVIEENGEVTVEEIKTARGRSFAMGARTDAFSQLRCYAYFVAQSQHLKKIKLRMRLLNSESGEIRDACSEATTDELYA